MIAVVIVQRKTQISVRNTIAVIKTACETTHTQLKNWFSLLDANFNTSLCWYIEKGVIVKLKWTQLSSFK